MEVEDCAHVPSSNNQPAAISESQNSPESSQIVAPSQIQPTATDFGSPVSLVESEAALLRKKTHTEKKLIIVSFVFLWIGC